MTIRKLFSMMMLAVAMLVATATASAEGFICPTTKKHVDVGDSMENVEANCGAPKQREDVMGRRCSKAGGCWEVKVGERWTYDFGQTYFIRYLLFLYGQLSQIEVGEYSD
jgi:hypothetical protein